MGERYPDAHRSTGGTSDVISGRRSQAASPAAPLRSAAAAAVSSSWPTQVGSAPRASSSSAVSRWPPCAAHQSALSRSSCGWRRRGELVADAVGEAERGGLPEGGARAALEQPARGRPLAEGDGVGHRGAAADHGAAGLDVGARVEQRVDRLDVVAARRPVQRRLGVRAGEPRVGVGAGRHERGDLLARLRDVARPVGDDVQRGPRLVAPRVAGARAVATSGCSRRNARSGAASAARIASASRRASGASAASTVAPAGPDA